MSGAVEKQAAVGKKPPPHTHISPGDRTHTQARIVEGLERHKPYINRNTHTRFGGLSKKLWFYIVERGGETVGEKII